MKCRIAMLVLLLNGGAIVNVAVAWGLQFYGPQTKHSASYSESENLDRWHRFARRHDLTVSQRLWSDHEIRGAGFSVNRVDYFPTLLGGTSILGTGDFLIHTECGWPLHSLHGWVFERREYCHCIRVDRRRAYLFKPPDDGCLPLRPQWAGFSVNTLFYAALIWLALCAPFAARRMIRRRRGRCANCAYPVGVSRVCTECGDVVSHANSRLPPPTLQERANPLAKPCLTHEWDGRRHGRCAAVQKYMLTISRSLNSGRLPARGTLRSADRTAFRMIRQTSLSTLASFRIVQIRRSVRHWQSDSANQRPTRERSCTAPA